MEEEMKRIALTGDINAFYRVIEREPGILKTIEDKDFAETPLHVAASVGMTGLAIEVLSLKPSFGRKLNPSGLIGVRSRERKTPLHYAAESDDADLVAEFLVACPTVIKELTIRGETAVHLAVLSESLNAFKVLMGWITRTDNNHILGWKDNKGNTVLHIAADTRQLENAGEEENKTSNSVNDSTIDKQKEKEGHGKVQNDKGKSISKENGNFKEQRRKGAYRRGRQQEIDRYE
ncbi:hypothetical protein BC332_15714 [Capsicum chinense]|nr:hypothetical protein BC332_15714 [Capsicum chinense]